PEMLVIADANRPVAIAGVMGGADSEVTDTTTSIVFESAYFNPLSVRRTARKLGMKTEASMRFERGADLMMPFMALQRALALLEELARHFGFDRIPSHCPALPAPPAAMDPRIVRARQLRAVLTGAGFSEAVTFGFISAAAAAPFAADGDIVPIANPLSETFAV